ncbi:MAG: RdgB/HAM1 family non-canonical purine NTP pyrophosphatase [Candidatus Sericytochromatia bacterium]|nr:RdgB/HAM1 family non-canonical purine NTP pyrophosphatase [Candidatus Sericytochromatia bacterium]
MTTILLVSTNPGKLDELRSLFETDEKAESRWQFALTPYPLEVDETGATFIENATLKAQAGAKTFNQPCLADDSGLCVEALGGRPGIHSARYAATPEARIARLLDELAGTSQRQAAFVCAMALAWPDGRLITVEGRCEGTILIAPCGTGGFGYDPIFFHAPSGRTFAELSKAEKNRFSHRAQAAAALKTALAGSAIG